MPKAVILDVPTPLGKAKSPRELVHEEIIKFLWEHQDVFNAEYGTIVKLLEVPTGGYGRMVTFGIQNKFNAVVVIWTPTNIELECEGSPYWRRKLKGTAKKKFIRKFRGAWEFIDYITRTFRL